jgi:anthranilate synthase component 1
VDGGLLQAVRARLGPPAVEVPGLPRFTGGAVGYLAYDAVRLFERIPDRHGRGEETLASFSFYRSLVAFDHVRQRLVLIADAAPAERREFERAQDALDALEGDLRARPAEGGPAPASPEAALPDPASFREAVVAAKEYIAAGDIFQVVLSRQGRVPCAAEPFAVYRALRMVNPSPYMYFLKDGDHAVAGASPEMLVRVEGRRVEARPIAGTRGRGATPEEDERLGRELLADDKERAEHVMLVDLGRNDLGRVCDFESVTVPEFMRLERYSHVTHIVSSVTGELAPGKDALDALVATFPAGTLTGAPKIRAMEIIDELEPSRRGLYGGALGYVDLRGNLDFCITIRTVVMRDGVATLQAGAGIVADSDPSAEERETEAKAGALFEALRLASRL